MNYTNQTLKQRAEESSIILSNQYEQEKEFLNNSSLITRVIQEINMFSLIKKDNRYYFNFDNMPQVQLTPEAKEDLFTAYLKEDCPGLYKDEMYLFDNIEILTILYGKTEDEAMTLLRDIENRINPQPLLYMTERPKISEESIKYLADSVLLNAKTNDNAEKDKFYRFLSKTVVFAAVIFFFTVCITRLSHAGYMNSNIIMEILSKFMS